MMRSTRKLLVFGGLFLFWFKLFPQEQKSALPNVIFIICDDLNDYQGVFGGHPQAITPNMDALAASGVQFLNAASNCPVCMPSRNSLFTGVYPHDSKDFGWTARSKHPVLKHNKPFVQLLRENGYYAAGSGKLLHTHEPGLWDSWGMNKNHNYGPLYYDGTNIGAHPGVPAPYREIGAVDGSYGDFSSAGGSPGTEGSPGFIYGRDLKPFRYVTDNDRDLMQDELHAQWAVEKLQQFETEKLEQPFFLGIGFVKPHTPLHAPKKYFDMYPLDELKLADWLEGDEKDTYYRDNFDPNTKGLRFYRTILESYNGDRELALKKFLQAYLACVTFVDDQIGMVMEGLENSVYRNNTIVILTSDHGWQMGEKQYLFKNSAWEESARVPLVIRAPDAVPGGKVVHPVSLVDIYPTLVDYCQLEGDHKVSGKGADLGGYSMRPFIVNPESGTWDGPDGALTMIGNAGLQTGVMNQNYSFRTRDWRYILYADGSEELYDHRTDSNEWYNLAYNADYVEIKKDLREKLILMLPQDIEALFSDGFEYYSVGTDVASLNRYQVWGQNSEIQVSDDLSGLGPYEGNQYALSNAFWGTLLVPLTLLAGRKYSWSVASKVEIDNPDDSWKRERSVQVKSGEHLYAFSDVDQMVDDWVVTQTEFTIKEGYENVNLQVTGNKNYPMGIDNFFLFEEKYPFLKLYYDGEIHEAEENGEILTLILHNGRFTNPLSEKSWTVEGLPAGIGFGNLSWVDSTMVQFELLGNATTTYEGTDIVGLSVTLDADQFENFDKELTVYDDVVFSARDTSTLYTLDLERVPYFEVYPNPAGATLTILQEGSVGNRVELFSMTGRRLLTCAVDAPYMRLPLPTGLRGVYLLRMFGEQSVQTKKVIIHN